MPTSNADEVGNWNSDGSDAAGPATAADDRWNDEDVASGAGIVSINGISGAVATGPPYRADHSWSGFTFDGIGASDTIDGIEVVISSAHIASSSGTDIFEVELYTDGGSHGWSENKASADVNVTTTGTDLTFGGATDKWNWTIPSGNAATDASFKVKVIAQGSAGGENFLFDTIGVRVYYTPSGVFDTDGYGVATIKTNSPDTFYANKAGQSVTLYINPGAADTQVETFTVTVPANVSWTGNSSDVALLDSLTAVNNATTSISGTGGAADSYVITVRDAFCSGVAGSEFADGCTITISNLRFDGGAYWNKFGANGTFQWTVQTARDSAAAYPIATQPTQTISLGTGAVLISEVDAANTDEWVELYNPESGTVDIGGLTIATSGSFSDATVAAGETIPGYGYYLIADAGYTGAADYLENITLANTNDHVWILNSNGLIMDSIAWGTDKAEGTALTDPTGSGYSFERFSKGASSSANHNATGGNGQDANNNNADFYERSSIDPQVSSDSEIPAIAADTGGYGEATIKTQSPDTFYVGSIRRSVTVYLNSEADKDQIDSFSITVPASLTWTGNSGDIALSDVSAAVNNADSSISGSGTSTDSWVIKVTAAACTGAKGAAGADGCTVTISNLRFDGGAYYNNPLGINALTHTWYIKTGRDSHELKPILSQPTQTLRTGTGSVLISEFMRLDTGTKDWVELYNPESYTLKIGSLTVTTSTTNDATVGASETIAGYGYYLIADAGYGSTADHLENLTFNTNDKIEIRNSNNVALDSVAWGTGAGEGVSLTDAPTGFSYERLSKYATDSSVHEPSGGNGQDADANSTDFFKRKASSDTNPQSSSSDTEPFSAAAGGKLIITPIVHVAKSGRGELTLTYTASAKDTYVSGRVDVGVPTGWSNPQITAATTPGYVTTSTTGDVASVSVSGETITFNINSLNPTQTFTAIYGNSTSGTDSNALARFGTDSNAQFKVTAHLTSQTTGDLKNILNQPRVVAVTTPGPDTATDPALEQATFIRARTTVKLTVNDGSGNPIMGSYVKATLTESAAGAGESPALLQATGQAYSPIGVDNERSGWTNSLGKFTIDLKLPDIVGRNEITYDVDSGNKSGWSRDSGKLPNPIISEMMHAPTGDFEYVEIYNPAHDTIFLADSQFHFGDNNGVNAISARGDLNIAMGPHSYLLITDAQINATGDSIVTISLVNSPAEPVTVYQDSFAVDQIVDSSTNLAYQQVGAVSNVAAERVWSTRSAAQQSTWALSDSPINLGGTIHQGTPGKPNAKALYATTLTPTGDTLLSWSDTIMDITVTLMIASGDTQPYQWVVMTADTTTAGSAGSDSREIYDSFTGFGTTSIQGTVSGIVYSTTSGTSWISVKYPYGVKDSVQVLFDFDTPGTTTLMSPADAAETTSVTPRFSWLAVGDSHSGVDSYVLAISENSSFTSHIVYDTFDVLVTETDLSAALDAKNYWWRVKPIDRAGIHGGWADSRLVTISPDVSGPNFWYVNDATYDASDSFTQAVGTLGNSGKSRGVPALKIDSVAFQVSAGDTILIDAGSHVEFDTISIETGPVWILGVDSSLTVISFGDSGASNFKGIMVDSYYFTIRDVAITNGYYGLFLNLAGTATVTRVRVEQNETGIIAKDSTGHTMSYVYARRNAGNGIVLNNVDLSTISQSRAFENAGAGFLLVGGSDSNSLDTNVADSNGTGFRLNAADSNYVRWSTTSGDTSVGFQLENSSINNVLYGDTANSSTDSGFAIIGGSENNQLLSNHAWSSGKAGFYLAGAHNATLDANWARFTTGAGFFLTRTNVSTLTRNRAYSGADSGFVLTLSQSNTIESNSAVGNTKGGFGFLNISHNNIVKSDSAIDNGGDGFFITSAGAAGSDSNIFQGNLSRGNTGSGFGVTASKNNLFVQNQVDSNLRYAFYLDANAVTDTITKNNINAAPWTVNDTGGVFTDVANASLIRNYWGTTDSWLINHKLHGPDSGTADYIGFRLGAVDTKPGVDSTAPAAPDTVATDTFAATSIRVSWARVTADEETNNDTPGVSGYRVYRTTTPTIDTSWAQIGGDVAYDTDSLFQTGLDNEVGYYYRVTAFDTATTENQSYFSASIAVDTTDAAAASPTDFVISADSSNAGHFQGIANGEDSATVYVVVSTSTGALIAGTTVVLTSSKGVADTIWPASCNTNNSGVCTFSVSTVSTTKSRLTVTMGGYRVLNETPTITWYDTQTGVTLGFGAIHPETSFFNVGGGAFVIWPAWRDDGRAIAYMAKGSTSDTWNIFAAFDDGTNGDTTADDGNYKTTKVTGAGHRPYHGSRPAWIDVLDASGNRDSDGVDDIVFSGRVESAKIPLFAVRANGADSDKNQGSLVALTDTTINGRWTMPSHPAGSDYIYAIASFEIVRFSYHRDTILGDFKKANAGGVHHMSRINPPFIHNNGAGAEATARWFAFDLAFADTNKAAASFIKYLPAAGRYQQGILAVLTNPETAGEADWAKVNDTTVFLAYRAETNVAWNLSWDTTKSVISYCVDRTGTFDWSELHNLDTRPDYVYIGTDFDVMGLFVNGSHATPNRPVALVNNSGTSNDLSLTFSRGDTARVAYISYDVDADTISLKIVEMDGRTTVDQNGGVLFENGKVTAIIDEGDVLSGSINIKVQKPAAIPATTTTDSIALTGNAREFFPDGQQFSDSITIILYYDATDLAAAGIANGSDSENLLKIYWYDGSGWRDMGAVVNPEDRNGALGSLTFVTNHFSIYGIGYEVTPAAAAPAAGDTYSAIWKAIIRLGGDRAIAGETITLTLEVKDSAGAAAKWPTDAVILINNDTWTGETKVVSPSATSITTRFDTAGVYTITVRDKDSSVSFELLVIAPPKIADTIVIVSGRKGVGQKLYNDDTQVTVIFKSSFYADTATTQMMLEQLPGETVLAWIMPSSFDSPLTYWVDRPVSITQGCLEVKVSRNGSVVFKDTIAVLGTVGSFRENPDTTVASLEVVIDTGAVDTPVTVSMDRAVPADTYAAALSKIKGQGRNLIEGSIIQLEAEDIDGNRIKKFNKKIKLKFPVKWKTGLRVVFLNNGEWEPVEPMTYDTVNEVAEVEVDHLSVWGVTAGFNAGPGVESVRIYPNPWRADGPTRGLATTAAAYGIKFDLLPAGNVHFRIFTVTGQKVLDGTLNPGTLGATAAGGHLQVVDVGGTTGQITRWDLLNQHGQEVASGLYLIVLEGPGGVATRKVAVIR